MNIFENILEIFNRKYEFLLTNGNLDKPHFLFFKNIFFSESNFKKLSKNKKLFFRNEDDFFTHKYNFDQIKDILFFIRFSGSSLFLFISKRVLFGKGKLIGHLNLKNEIQKLIDSRKIFITKFGYMIFLFIGLKKFEENLFTYKIIEKIPVDSRLGVFIWMETHYRLGLFNPETFDQLDTIILNKLQFVNETKINQYNSEIFDLLVFYCILKDHFIKMYISKQFSNCTEPLYHYVKNHSNFKVNFISRLNQDFFNKLESEKFYYFCDEKQHEVNYKGSLFQSSLDLINKLGNSLSHDFEKTKDEKIYLTEDSLQKFLFPKYIEAISKSSITVDNLKIIYQDSVMSKKNWRDKFI